MKTIDQMTDEEILETIRENGKKEGTAESYIYGLLSTAHPNVVLMIEQQALQMKKVAYAMGKQLNEDSKDPGKKAEILAALERAAHGFKASRDDDEEIPEM